MPGRRLEDGRIGLPGWSRSSLVFVLLLAGACRDAGADHGGAALRYLRLSKYGQALESVRRARAERPSTPLEGARLRLLEAEILVFAQKEGDGLALLAQPLEPEAVAALSARHAMLTGAALRRQGHWPEARQQLLSASAAARRINDRETEAKAAVQLATGYFRRGQWTESAAELERAASVASALGDRDVINNVRFTRASLLMRREEPDRSTEIFRVIASEAEQRGDIVELARALDNMAINYQSVGDYERALDFSERAMRAFDKLDLPDSKMQSHGSHGLLLLSLDRAEDAVVDLERAVAIARERRNSDEIGRWSGNLTVALLALDRLDQAELLTNQTLAEDPKRQYSLANRGLIHERRGRPAEARRDWETVLAGSKVRDDLRWDALFGLARLHTAANQRAPAERRYREVLKLVDEKWSTLRTDDSRLTFLTRAIDVRRSYVAALERWGDDNEALRVEEASRARLLGDHGGGAGPGIGIAALSSLAARTNSVFLSYWIAPGEGSHVRVIGAGRAERVPLAGATPREITRLVREHNDLVERQLEDPRQKGTAAARLYDLLIKPLSSRLPPGARVVVIPDAALHFLNFETLVREKDGRKGFWIEDVTLQVAPSLSLLQEERRVKPAASQHLLLMGDALQAPGFGRLDHAAAEMKMVKDIFGAPAVTELVGDRATPSAYAASSPGSHTHIHFTAHAKADHESPLDSAVILTPEPVPGGEPRYRLLAREVAGIALHADVVTVSACRGAGVRAVHGEGMVGFSWAFLRAGASNVVAGLWDVNDRSTARLMAELYAGIHAGKPPVEALRDAKLAFLARNGNYAKPYYWAPFQIYSRSLAHR